MHVGLSLMEHYGVFALFVLLLLEAIGVPAPGESALIAASAAAGLGDLDIRHVIIAGWMGSVLGDNIGYFVGHRFGKPAILQYGGKIGLTPDRYAKAESLMHKYGPLVIVFARFVVILRQFNGLVAGATNVPWRVFIVADAIGAGLWVGFWSLVAFELGHKFVSTPFLLHHISIIGFIALALALVAGLTVYLKQRAKRAPPERLD